MSKAPEHKTLYYFTESYPYGISEQWKRNELEVFRKHFARIVVIPRSFGGNDVPRNRVEGIEYRRPLFSGPSGNSLIQKARLQASGVLRTPFLKEALTSAASKRSVLRLLKHAYQVELVKRNPAFREVLDTSTRPAAVLYFYWGIGIADVVPFMRPTNDLLACRFHGWDLYEDRHPNGTIPFRRELLRRLDLALPCSDFGSRYLAGRYPEAAPRIHTARLGTLARGRSPQVEDGRLKIVSCSSVTRVKRLDRLCSALERVDFPLTWTHIGDGLLMKELRDTATRLPSNVSVELLGSVPSADVLALLSSRPFDLFLNVSESEGVPVSIMEAFSAGIPVCATDVGGTSEIVDDTVGKLLPADGDPRAIARELRAFHDLAGRDRSRLREAALERYRTRCDAHVNAEQLATLILGACMAKQG